MAPPFPLSDRATDVRPGCKTQRIDATLRQVADLVCALTKERGYFKTCIVGHVNCCLQCAPTLTATSVLQVSHDKSRRLQCGSTLRPNPRRRQQFTCPTIHVLKYLVSLGESTPSRLRLPSCRSIGAILCVLQAGLTSVALLDKGKEGAIT
ncbi:hypothetical protein PoB_000463600 [Plakobranchus ocellatus]|uniref:Uncharacterized protein n=1 Tax=Plakobranchus ocellatus TaxID=259542 RepID=A0AAV3Y6T9_9GAST|nr:hypothetical protein PoB_000463600 [Plakobranchus ocellatus]